MRLPSTGGSGLDRKQDMKKTALKKKKVLLVDDHPIVRQGLAQVVDQEADLSVCGQATKTQDAMKLMTSEKPDLAVVDVTLAEENGIDLIRQMKAVRKEMPVLVVSMHDEFLYAERVLKAGASGYIMKQEPAGEIVNAMRKVLAGGIAVSPKVAERVLDKMSHATVQSPLETLSDRELEVLGWVGQGMGTRQIAEKLCLSIKTVEAHRENIKRKLHIKRAPELVRYAVQWVQSGGQRV